MPQINQDTTWVRRHWHEARLALVIGGPLTALIMLMAGWLAYTFVTHPPQPKIVVKPVAHVGAAPRDTPTAAQIQQAQQDTSSEGIITALTEDSLTIQESGSARSLKLNFTPGTTFTKTALSAPGSRAELRTGSRVLAYYHTVSNQLIAVSYDL